MLIALWITAGLLAVALLAAGGMKLARPREALVASGQGWAGDFSVAAVKSIGLLEVLAALGLVLPKLLGIATILGPLAALGAALLMAGAVVVHIRRQESPAAPIVLGLLAIASAILGLAAL
jgi:hypothetical protein